MTAGEITNRLLLAVPQQHHGARLWRHNVGVMCSFRQVREAIEALSRGQAGEALRILRSIRPVKFGLPGQPDLDGWVPINGHAVRLGIEVKAGKDRQSEEQLVCQRVYLAAGAIYIVAREVDQTMADLAKAVAAKESLCPKN